VSLNRAAEGVIIDYFNVMRIKIHALLTHVLRDTQTDADAL